MNDHELFSAFFEAVHGVSPFPWQRRLFRHVREGGWPELLDLPTGTGKTSALDVALVHLALDDAMQGRTASMRVVYVVDRRTIVDQAFERARRLLEALRAPTVDAVRTIADRLRALSGNEAEPLHAALLRGGMPREDAWARRPDQPTLVVSTVDQVGSRLLFRGYGVSDSMKPVHAGLLGHDTLFLLDEVHLSTAFRDTLHALASTQPDDLSAETSFTRRTVVEMSATAEVGEREVFRLGEEDYAHPVLSRRLNAAKPARLVEVKVPAKQPDKALERFARAVTEAAGEPARAGLRVAVVVNRLATARQVFASLRAEFGRAADVRLVTGRMRALDRTELEREVLLPRVGSGWKDDQPPLVVVATQCIEAGADFDFDVLVTECASFDALRQRFGRLNRMGRPIDAQGVILMRSDSKTEDDPVYGEALAKTWASLNASEGVDFRSVGGVAVADSACLAPAQQAPMLFPAYLDAWTQTAPRPAPDPDVSLFLHGIKPTRAEVQLVWRADIEEELLAREDALEHVLARLAVCPPSSLEALSVPLDAVRRWLAGQDADDVADVEGARTVSRDRRSPRGRAVVRWRGDDSAIVFGRELAPGDVLVVPSTYGGLTEGTWDPTGLDPVADLGMLANIVHRGRLIVRLLPRALGYASEEALPWPLPKAGALEQEEAEDPIDAWLSSAIETTPRDGRAELLREQLLPLVDRNARRVVNIEGVGAVPGYLTVIGKRRAAVGEPEPATEQDTGSFGGRAIPLSEHLRGVGALAAAFSERCGLIPSLAHDVAMAARWHDLGKIDPRFQAWLRGGDELAAAIGIASGEVLAKSTSSTADHRARRAARRRARYPEGARHELLSVALLELSSILSESTDRDLVLHLVGSHHGHCRPLAPICFDESPVPVSWVDEGDTFQGPSDHHLHQLGSGVAERFFALQRRYGWHGLAYLETLVRLADHRRSEAEQLGGNA